jgi:hypothetical protein
VPGMGGRRDPGDCDAKRLRCQYLYFCPGKQVLKIVLETRETVTPSQAPQCQYLYFCPSKQVLLYERLWRLFDGGSRDSQGRGPASRQTT